MDTDKIAKRLATEELVARNQPNPMNGLRKQQVVKIVNEAMHPYTRGFFRDDDWRAVRRVWKALDDLELDWVMTDNKYKHDDEGRPNAKEWKFEVYFLNERGKKHKLYGIVIASGAGSIEDPLAKYDIIAYAN